ncbi:DUF7768 domain-containing protein [Winogradskya humida]|uniref:DUF7768 domain-containing protein n=1 Tax=Winogradskya humida TaxID=113566 RepID=A0ABQ4A351_9ACTN|nr:hypothetical protein [Actinoplanes humidus]GIE25281.1 hypothetical protein Ahu01nite_083830 [Actinoplanes humidus]
MEYERKDVKVQDVTGVIPVVYTAHSKLTFFCRDVIAEFVLRQNRLPLNPFRIFDYFLGDRVDRDLVRRGNNNLVRIANEIWVFGDIADGVLLEIRLAEKLGKPVRYFTLGTRVSEIVEVLPSVVTVEDEVLQTTGLAMEQIREALESAHRAANDQHAASAR